MTLNLCTKFIISFLIVAIAFPAYAQREEIKGFEKRDLTILNEELRKIWDRLFRVKSNEDDAEPRYLDAAQLSVIKDKDEDTKVDTEETTDEDKIRADIAGVEKLLLSGTATESYIKFNAHKDSDADTKIQVEEATDEDYIRMDVKGTEAFVIYDSCDVAVTQQSFFVPSDKKIGFEGVTADTYWFYDSSEKYLTGYVDGTKRIEL